MAEVGLFLHTPFPSSEIFRTLSVRADILRGMLSADHIGFHLFEYARHFLTSCRRILYLKYTPQQGGYVGVEYNGRTVAVTISHIGIEPPLLAELAKRESVQTGISELTSKYSAKGKVLAVGIDQLERLKGIPLKLLAIEGFLASHPEWVPRVQFMQIGILDSDCESFQREANEKCRKEVATIVKRINDTYRQALGENIIIYEEHTSTQLDKRMPLWCAGDILLITSIRDAVNLYPFEFVCAQEHAKKTGVLVLSEFSGSSRVFNGAIGINPWKRDEIIQAIELALNMPMEEKSARHDKDLEYALANTTTRWAERVLIDLKRVRKHATDGDLVGYGLGLGFRMLEFNVGFRKLEIDQVSRSYRSSFRRVLIFDYGGTLVTDEQSGTFSKYCTPTDHMEKLSVSTTGMPPTPSNVLSALRMLAADSSNTVFVISGRDREELVKNLGMIPGLGLAAEHGYYYRWGQRSAEMDASMGRIEEDDRWLCTKDNYDDSWKDLTHSIMDVYTQRTHGTYIERKGSALLWQYRDADPEFGQLQVTELQDQLTQVLEHFSVEIILGRDYLEVRPEGVNKGVMVDRIVSAVESTRRTPVDFVLCLGDDQSDESMFGYMEELCPLSNKAVYTCTVGKKPSAAKYFMNDVEDVHELLESMIKMSTTASRNLSMNDLSSYHSRQLTSPVRASVTVLATPPADLKTAKHSMSMSSLSSAAMVPKSSTLEQYFSNIEEKDDEDGGIFF